MDPQSLNQLMGSQTPRTALEARLAALESENRDLQSRCQSTSALLDAAQADGARYREIFDLAPDAYLITDPNGTIREANWASAVLLGTQLEKLAGKPLVVFVPAPHRRHFRTQLARLHELIILEPWETYFKPRGKQEFPVEIHLGAIRDAKHNLRGFHWIVRDIRRRREAEARVLGSQRLSAIGEMIAGLAHESRNALQRSQACISMLRMELKDSPEGLSLVERLRNAQLHLSRLYEEVRVYAAPCIVERQSCDLRKLLDDTWAEVSGVHEDRNVSLKYIGPPLPNSQVWVDSFAVAQVFRNIFENAIAACSDPVTVRVSLRDMWLQDTERAVEARILDNGPGFGDEARQKVFDPFFTTKSQGTGLGMAIAKRIVEEHDGSIAVGSGTEGGAELIVILPRSAS